MQSITEKHLLIPLGHCISLLMHLS